MFWHILRRTRPSQDDLATDDLVTDDLYHFQPLSAPTTIRLIKVLPKKVMGHIACRIFHFNEKEQEAIGYHALSYVWGDPERRRQIYLQDDQYNEWRPFPLHDNLWQFLDHTWRSKLFDQLFWTDFLCLDQEGHDEISHQVPRMHVIYRNAELVVIWLQLKKEEQKGLRKVVRWGHRPKLMPKVLHSAIQQRLSRYHKAVWGALINPYWGRIWIVQEVVVAKKVCVTSRDTSIDLDELRVLVDSFTNTEFWADMGDCHQLVYSFAEARWWAQGPTMWVLCDMRAVGGKMPMWRILQDFRRYQSSRSVDRVFGMLGMVEDLEDGSSPAENIQVDYEKSMEQVLLDAMFESSLPLAEYRMAASWLDKVFLYGFPLLKNYIGHSKTMERHRHFGRIALRAFEAFSMITFASNVRYSPNRDVTDLTHDLFSSAANADWKPTLSQSAGLIGLLLSSLNRGPRPTWITRCDKFEEDWASPWRCAAHGSQDGDHTGHGTYEKVAGVLKTQIWDRRLIVDACVHQSKSCNGSIMACEISDIGLRLQVEPGISPAYASRLSLYCLKVEA